MFIAPRKSPRSSQTPSATFSSAIELTITASLGFPRALDLESRGWSILVVCLALSMAIAIYRLVTTPTEILGDGFREPAGQAALGKQR